MTQLEKIDEFEEDLCQKAGLRHVDRESVPYPISFMKLLYGTNPGFEPDMVPWHHALERTLQRLKIQLAWFNAYNIWSRLAPKDMAMTYADLKCREHCGYAPCLLSAWNQLAHLLNLTLDWKITRKRVAPRSIKNRARQDPDVGNDPWLGALVRRLERIDDLFEMRHGEAHDLGLGDRLFSLFVPEGTTDGRMDAVTKFELLRDEYHFLGTARRNMSDFLILHEVTIAKRHAPTA